MTRFLLIASLALVAGVVLLAVYGRPGAALALGVGALIGAVVAFVMEIRPHWPL